MDKDRDLTNAVFEAIARLLLRHHSRWLPLGNRLRLHRKRLSLPRSLAVCTQTNSCLHPNDRSFQEQCRGKRRSQYTKSQRSTRPKRSV